MLIKVHIMFSPGRMRFSRPLEQVDPEECLPRIFGFIARPAVVEERLRVVILTFGAVLLSDIRRGVTVIVVIGGISLKKDGRQSR